MAESPSSPTPTPAAGDRMRIEHMLRAARDAQAVLGSRDEQALTSDMVRSRALVNCFTEIGEAASRLTLAGRASVGTLPWREIVGMRNIVVHVYWGIDLVELIKTTREDLPPLIMALEEALARWPEPPKVGKL